MTGKTYRINAAAERVGLSADVLRIWERRYRGLSARRTSSGYRAYSEFDLEVLRRLKRVTDSGVSIAEAVKLLPTIRREVRALKKVPLAPLPKGQVERWTQRILDAAGRLDQARVGELLDEAMAALEPVTYFERLVAPLERLVGERWHAGELSVAEEHLVTAAVRQRVMALLLRAPKGTDRHVVCACFPNEEHELGLFGAALKFHHAGFRVTVLGARTPAEHLARTVRVTGATLVALSAIYDEGPAAFASTLESMVAGHQGVRFVVGGRAAETHRTAVEQAGASLVQSDEAWRELLADVTRKSGRRRPPRSASAPG